MAQNERLIRLSDLQKYPIRINHYDKKNGNEHFVLGIESVIEYAENLPNVDAVPVARCKYCDPGSQDYNPCWLCKKGGTAHDVEHCHKTNYGDYEPMQPHCHLCGRKL